MYKCTENSAVQAHHASMCPGFIAEARSWPRPLPALQTVLEQTRGVTEGSRACPQAPGTVPASVHPSRSRGTNSALAPNTLSESTGPRLPTHSPFSSRLFVRMETHTKEGHRLSLLDVALTCLSICGLPPSLFLFACQFLLKNLDCLSYGSSHSLDFADYIPWSLSYITLSLLFPVN